MTTLFNIIEIRNNTTEVKSIKMSLLYTNLCGSEGKFPKFCVTFKRQSQHIGAAGVAVLNDVSAFIIRWGYVLPRIQIR